MIKEMVKDLPICKLSPFDSLFAKASIFFFVSLGHSPQQENKVPVLTYYNCSLQVLLHFYG